MVELKITDLKKLYAVADVLKENGYLYHSYINFTVNGIDGFCVQFDEKNDMEAVKMGITCCKDCVKPKRYPGCHDRCPEYLAEKKKYEEEKEAERKRKHHSVYEQREDSVEKAYKRNGGRKRV